jgi:hypothetical protein
MEGQKMGKEIEVEINTIRSSWLGSPEIGNDVPLASIYSL